MLPIAKEGAKCLVGRQSHGSEGGGSNPPSPPYLRHQPPALHHPLLVHQDAPVCCSSCRPPPPPPLHPPYHLSQQLQRHHSTVSVSTHPAHLHHQAPLPLHLQQHVITSSTAQHHFQHHPHLHSHLHASQSSHHLHSISVGQQQQQQLQQQQQQPQHHFFHHPPPPHEVMRERKAGGALSKVQKLKRRISLSFGKLAISRSEDDPSQDPRSKRSISGLKVNGFSDEYLDKIEPNGNIPDKECGWDRLVEHETLSRQLSVSSDSKLLDDDIREEQNIILRPKKPPRPKSEVYLCKDQRRSKRYSAFGGDSPFGRTEAYVKLDQLGEGSYATVYKGYSNLTNQVVALKEIRLQEEEGAPFTAIREASLLKQLKHTNIVTLHDIIHTRETLTFVFEYVHTDLSQYLERHSGGLHPRNVQLFLLQLLRGLAYCHRRRILHRDIKPQNLLISELGELKIADFGLARAKSVPSRTYSHEVVTLWYRPPDVLLGSTDYTTSLDLWGVGCIFVEMITGAPAFPGVRDVHDQLDKVFKVVGTPTEASYPGVSLLPQYRPHRLVLYRARRLSSAFPPLADIPSAETLASIFLQILPSRRVSCDAALRHKYFGDLSTLTFNLDPERSIFTLPNIRLAPEINNLPAHHNRERNRRI